MGHMGNFSASLAHTPFHAILLWGNQSKSLRVLIDSGADEIFLDATLSIPMDVGALDGRSIGRVTHNTTPINLRMSGNHSETIQCLLIKSPQIPVVLRFSWIQLHNPSPLSCPNVLPWTLSCIPAPPSPTDSTPRRGTTMWGIESFSQ